jgi:hypothetical protein
VGDQRPSAEHHATSAHEPQEARNGRRLAGWFAASPELIPGIVAVGVFAFWGASDGGVIPTDSYPGSLILLGVLAVTIFAYRTRIGAVPRVAWVALVLLAGFVIWNFVSIAWADDQGAAWDGANRCLLFLVVFTLFVVPAWSGASGALIIGLYAFVIALIGGITLAGAAGATDPLTYLIANRFAKPTGYYNADAALFTIAMFPAFFLATRRETPWPLRGVMLASAGVLFELALLPQSRGWLIAAPVALLAYLLFVPRPSRSLILMAPLAIVMALAAPQMLDVYNAGANPAQLGSALHSARDAMVVSAAVLLVLGMAVGFADARVDLPDRIATVGNAVILGAAGLVALAGAVIAISVIGNPVSWAGDRWDEIKSGNAENSFHGSRLGQGLGSNRYDFWRVAADEFSDHPLVGVGTENFAEDYVRARHSDEEPTHPHNLPLRVLAQTGVIGFGLFLGFLVAVLFGLTRRRLVARSALSRGIAGTVGVVFVYWFVHSLGDWFWAFPALTAPVFAWLGMGMRLDAPRAAAIRTSRTRWSIATAVAGGIVVVVGAASLFLPWAAAVEVKKAADSWGANPRAAFNRLDRAADLNFLSAQPYLVEGAIAAELGDRQRVRSGFTRALERDPRNWYATLELAALDGIEGRRAAALERLKRVVALNPRESETAVVRQGVIRGNPITLRALDRAFVVRYCQRLGRTASRDGSCQ